MKTGKGFIPFMGVTSISVGEEERFVGFGIAPNSNSSHFLEDINTEVQRHQPETNYTVRC
jgi:hypothetical protein